MMTDYINYLKSNGWIFKENTAPLNRENTKKFANGRLQKADNIFFDFINKYKVLANEKDDVWYISIHEYSSSIANENEFTWNNFENESLEYADSDEEKKEIISFWDNHFPFLFSVKNGYAYIALVLAGDDKGKIILGREPEYENVEIISASFEAFQHLHSDFLENKKEVRILSDFK